MEDEEVILEKDRKEGLANQVEAIRKDNSNLVAFSYLELKERFPKGIKAFEDFLLGQLQGMTLEEDTLIGLFLYAPTVKLVEFFDNRGIYINIKGSDQNWTFNIDVEEQEFENTSIAVNRAIAITVALTKAFEINEKQDLPTPKTKSK